MTDYPDWLKSDGEAPFYTEWYGTVNEAYKEGHPGGDLFGDMLSDEWAKRSQIYGEMDNTAVKEVLVDVFNTKYYPREIGAETVDMFTINLRRWMQTVMPKYGAAFDSYGRRDFGLGLVQDIEMHETDDNMREYEDTPNTELQGQYLTDRTTVSGGRHWQDAPALEVRNRLLAQWRDICGEFVAEFEPCFMQSAGRM